MFPTCKVRDYQGRTVKVYAMDLRRFQKRETDKAAKNYKCKVQFLIFVWAKNPVKQVI